MLRVKKIVTTMCLLWTAGILSYAIPGYGQALGELLYSTHCVACHTKIIHWREKTLATDWHSLKSQVHRWQSNIGLDWSEDEITDVTRYLNAAYYHFPVTDKQDLSESNTSYQNAISR